MAAKLQDPRGAGARSATRWRALLRLPRGRQARSTHTRGAPSEARARGTGRSGLFTTRRRYRTRVRHRTL